MDFKLRKWNQSDVESLAFYANNINISQNLTDRFPYPYTKKDAKSFIKFAQDDDLSYIFAIEINGEVAGGIGLHGQKGIYRKNFEIGYWLAEKYWGNGIVSKAIKQMVKYGFENTSISRIFAKIYGRNIASQKVIQKSGFTFEAKFEKSVYKNEEYLDELVYAIRRENFEKII